MIREFLYSPVDHVVTVFNIDIVDRLGNFDHLKRVIRFGYKYRIQSSDVTWGKIKHEIIVMVENLKNIIIPKNIGNINDLHQWERTLKCRGLRIRLMFCKFHIA